MTPPASATHRAIDAGGSAVRIRRASFTLVEVVVAIGVFAVTIVAVIGLMTPLSRSVAGVSDFDKAAQLGDAIQAELVRLRDLTASGNKLDALYNASFAGGKVLTLVAPPDTSRVVRESDADNDPATGSPPGVFPRDRYFLIEIRAQSAPLNYTPGSNQAFLAVTAIVKWPYQIATGPNAPAAAAADATQTSSLLLNFAVPP